MTHTAEEPEDAGAASAARQAAVVAAQRCSAPGIRFAPLPAAPLPGAAHAAAVTELRRAVEAYVGALKNAGRPPEATVLLVKQVIAEIGAPPDETEALRREAVRWTIDAYYAT